MKEGAGIRFAIVALPLGLLIIGIGSMLMTVLKKPGHDVDVNEAIRMEAASINRKPVNKEDMERYLRILTEEIGERNLGVPDQLEKSAVWIESTLRGGNIGYKVERQSYSVGDKEVRNLIAELPGGARRDEIVIIGAHYDTVPACPGANDNGSGVAGLLSLARAFAGDSQDCTIRFVFFANEEPPYFQTNQMGSVQYAKRCKERGENIVAMLALDTIGFFSEDAGSQKYPEGMDGDYPEKGNFLAFVANDASRYFADAARVSFMSESGIPALASVLPEEMPGVGWSDHWSFWQEGFPGVMVTDTAPYRYPHYHKPTDTLDKIDIEKLTEVCKGLKAVVDVWANP